MLIASSVGNGAIVSYSDIAKKYDAGTLPSLRESLANVRNNYEWINCIEVTMKYNDDVLQSLQALLTVTSWFNR